MAFSKIGLVAVSLAALVVAVASVLVHELGIVALVALAWLGVMRHRQAQRKHAGLRVLR